MMINFIVVDIPPLFWTLVNLVRHLVCMCDKGAHRDSLTW